MELNLAVALQVWSPFHPGIMKSTAFAPKARVSTPCCYTYGHGHLITAPRKRWSLGPLTWNQFATLRFGWSSVTRTGHFSVKAVEHNKLEHIPRSGSRSEDWNLSLDGGTALEEGYIGLFIRLLGRDNAPPDKDQAIKTLWQHSNGGKQFIDEIVKFDGSVILTVSHLSSDMPSTAEAAAGLLRNISSINSYRTLVSEAGAVEEIAGLLTRRSLPPEVKEQSMCVLWNLSVDEKLRAKMANSELLSAIIQALNDCKVGVKEAAAGVLANLAMSECNHCVMVEAGVIPKLANILKDNKNASKVARREARNALLELVTDSYHKLLVIEEGLVLVPLIDASAFRFFKPRVKVPDSLLEGVDIKEAFSTDCGFGAGQLLPELNAKFIRHELDKTSRMVIEMHGQQQFLAQIEVSEKDEGTKPQTWTASELRVTLMPWWDGIARLVFILLLDDLSAVERAAYSIADICINEEMRIAIQEAGAIPHLVRLLGHQCEALKVAATFALERLSLSYKVCRSIESHGAVDLLIYILKENVFSDNLTEKVVTILCRLLQSGEEVKVMIQSRVIPGLLDIMNSESTTAEAKTEAEGILDEISATKFRTRDKIVSGGGLPFLVNILKKGGPSLQEKAACVLENLAITESFAAAIIEAGVEAGLKAMLKLEDEHGELSNEELEHVSAKQEEIWSAIGAASRLLVKLLGFKGICNSIECIHFVHVLRRILKSKIPLNVKDWVAACLLKLDFVGMASDLNFPINLEVNLHDTIPKLIEGVGVMSSPTTREKAVVELHNIVSQGVLDYSVAMANRGAIFPLVNLLGEGSERAQEAALAILYNLGMDEENHPAIVAAGAIPHLERLVHLERSESKVALYLLRALQI